MAQFLKLPPEFEVVIDFAVEDYPGGARLVVNRLLAALEVNDGETTHGESRRAFEVKAVFIRPAMAYRLAHTPQQLTVNRSIIAANYSYDSTHFNSSVPIGYLYLLPLSDDEA
jgi:hypothetical protein